jgi:DUF4097 and DUF4098 domain-containing protein YvlB
MSETLTYSAAGVVQLIVESLAPDAVLRGMPDATDIEITCHGQAAEFVPEGDVVRFVGGLVERIIAPDSLHIAARSALGDLRVQRLGGEVHLQDVRGDLRLERLTGQVLLQHAAGDIRADDVAELHILGGCSGDLRFSGGNLVAEMIAGDLRVSEGAAVRLNSVHGDLWLETLSGSVDIGQAYSDARLAELGGAAHIGRLMGDLRATDIAGGLDVPELNGDVILEGPFGAGAAYSISANGDVQLALPANADVRLTVRATGRIRSDVPLTPMADGTPTFSATIGEGASEIHLAGRGDLRVTQEGASGKGWQGHGAAEGDPFADLHNLGDRIRQQVSASLAAAGINIESGEINWGRGARGFRGPRPVPPAPPVPPTPPAPPARAKAPEPPRATAAEQIAILQMVQDGKISADEADLLLRALGK